MNRLDLERLSREELIDLVLRLQRPVKTSRTSSQPPSTDRKDKRENARPGGAKSGHEGHSRSLHDAPDAFEDHTPVQSARCGAAFAQDAVRQMTGEYDEIELPPIAPFVRRHRRFSCVCACCGSSTSAPAPACAQKTPFGPRIHALAVYLKTTQLFSYARLQAAFSDLFGLSISQGALMNLFIRAKPAFAAQSQSIVSVLRRSPFVSCDETGARIEGVNAYEWVFCAKDAVVHVADFSRSAQVVRTTMGDHRPQVWSSDRYSAQQGHGERHQTCLAHLDRKARFADDNSEDETPFRLRLWFDRAFAFASDIKTCAASTRRRKRRALENDLDAILKTPGQCSLTRDLLAQLARARDQLLTFCDFAGAVEPTNNVSERALRPCVIQRKVTNGYRAKWAADHEANVRTTIDTARLAGRKPFMTILQTIAV